MSIRLFIDKMLWFSKMKVILNIQTNLVNESGSYTDFGQAAGRPHDQMAGEATAARRQRRTPTAGRPYAPVAVEASVVFAASAARRQRVSPSGRRRPRQTTRARTTQPRTIA